MKRWDQSSNGNYLGILELLAIYDDFLKKHIQEHANRGSGHINYLSSTICEQIIEMMDTRVLGEIVSRIKKSLYYSISLDSTPDVGHVDQLTLIFRYMENTTPAERFVMFMLNQGHKAQDIYDGLFSFLTIHEIDIKHCRGQSYDNAAVMSGRYNDVQAKIVADNRLATWISCAGHSLNLVSKSAAECCQAAVGFVDFVKEIYTFFTASTYRYELLTDNLKLGTGGNHINVPKRVITTRWSCRADACKALL